MDRKAKLEELGFDTLHDTNEAAEIVTLSKSNLEHRRIKGLPPAYYRFGKAIRYASKDLQEFIESRKSE